MQSELEIGLYAAAELTSTILYARVKHVVNARQEASGKGEDVAMHIEIKVKRQIGIHLKCRAFGPADTRFAALPTTSAL
jgi:hypothetical protein